MIKDNSNKRKRKQDKMEVDDAVEEDYNIYYDQDNAHINKNIGENEVNNELINVDFLFSEIRDTYFFGIKGFFEGLLDFEEFNNSEIADIVLSEKDYLGTVIKTELEEESGNDLPDLYAFVSFVPFSFFPQSNCMKQIINYCIKNIKKNLSSGALANDQASQALGLLNGAFNDSPYKLGLFANERASNLPQQLIAPLLNLIREDIKNYKEANEGFPKYDFTHLLYITK